mmetsp:Transcript_91744/g.137385  ORF Transcript_91744/g.137385 Transcript_91744/m.137385 type:complete len:227 (-) Transcript_91744:1089-1769(-)
MATGATSTSVLPTEVLETAHDIAGQRREQRRGTHMDREGKQHRENHADQQHAERQTPNCPRLPLTTSSTRALEPAIVGSFVHEEVRNLTAEVGCLDAVLSQNRFDSLGVGNCELTCRGFRGCAEVAWIARDCAARPIFEATVASAHANLSSTTPVDTAVAANVRRLAQVERRHRQRPSIDESPSPHSHAAQRVQVVHPRQACFCGIGGKEGRPSRGVVHIGANEPR